MNLSLTFKQTLKLPQSFQTTQTTFTMFRQTLARNVRLFSTSVRTQKSAVDAAKDAAKTVDKTVSQTIVKGIEGAGKLLDIIQL